MQRKKELYEIKLGVKQQKRKDQSRRRKKGEKM